MPGRKKFMLYFNSLSIKIKEDFLTSCLKSSANNNHNYCDEKHTLKNVIKLDPRLNKNKLYCNKCSKGNYGLNFE